jgi:hypothetical protein
MPVTGKKDESYIRFPRLLKRPVVHPALFDWSAIIFHSKKDQRGCGYPVQLEET